MGDKIINELLTLYDEYLDTLRHISEFDLDIELVNRINGFTSSHDIEAFINGSIDDAHKELIDGFINKMFGIIDLKDVRDLRTYIYYPDFNVKTYINNPANIYIKNITLEKAIIISPTYELNLISNNSAPRGRLLVLRVKRLDLSPKICVFSCTSDTVDKFTFRCLENDLINKFKESFGSVPNKDDLVLLRSLSIKFILEKIKTDHENGMDVLFQGDSFISYDYGDTKKKICEEYNVAFEDIYRSLSSVNTPWTFRGLMNFDNRALLPNQDNSVIPLSYMRTLK